jgi:hypothetical protein
MTDYAEPLRAGDMDVRGGLFALRFTEGCSNGCVELYMEDDGWYHLTATFDRVWLPDLAKVAGGERP